MITRHLKRGIQDLPWGNAQCGGGGGSGGFISGHFTVAPSASFTVVVGAGGAGGQVGGAGSPGLANVGGIGGYGGNGSNGAVGGVPSAVNLNGGPGDAGC